MAKDRCVLCGKETQYDVSTHIDFRNNYIEGAGQICDECSNGKKEEPPVTMKKTQQRDEHCIMVCECGDSEHHLLFTLDSDDPQVWLHYQLALEPWYKRIWIGIKYIFGHQSRYGMYGELIITERNIDSFEKIVAHVKKNK